MQKTEKIPTTPYFQCIRATTERAARLLGVPVDPGAIAGIQVCQ